MLETVLLYDTCPLRCREKGSRKAWEERVFQTHEGPKPDTATESSPTPLSLERKGKLQGQQVSTSSHTLLVNSLDFIPRTMGVLWGILHGD